MIRKVAFSTEKRRNTSLRSNHKISAFKEGLGYELIDTEPTEKDNSENHGDI